MRGFFSKAVLADACIVHTAFHYPFRWYVQHAWLPQTQITPLASPPHLLPPPTALFLGGGGNSKGILRTALLCCAASALVILLAANWVLLISLMEHPTSLKAWANLFLLSAFSPCLQDEERVLFGQDVQVMLQVV